MISFADDFLAQVDRLAQEEHRSRSELGLLCAGSAIWRTMDRIAAQMSRAPASDRACLRLRSV